MNNITLQAFNEQLGDLYDYENAKRKIHFELTFNYFVVRVRSEVNNQWQERSTSIQWGIIYATEDPAQYVDSVIKELITATEAA